MQTKYKEGPGMIETKLARQNAVATFLKNFPNCVNKSRGQLFKIEEKFKRYKISKSRR